MRQNIQVPFGYEPPVPSRKGTVIFYDSFMHISDEELDFAAKEAARRAFAKLVLYPLHELTVKRMSNEQAGPFYQREDRLHEWKRERGAADVEVLVEGWEGKRKKYTPADAAFRYLTEKYPAPYFLYMTPDMANRFAGFSSFEEWIVKLRLLLSDNPAVPHPKLEKYRHRWNVAGETEAVPERPAGHNGIRGGRG
ncbi:hypothetical protein EHV15_00760 [Paenibacillus oralis]|uniref:Uncharacterized protein n=1 Tax=Paenibacillus oralis TaxID=2490856 RepID=A0A3P3TU50_9BACL|nr:hypothetical protein [Paenibacillus oralis]RRJ61665.1 hypothetical protein EHV15_00760 [Paenibacillus oralis]